MHKCVYIYIHIYIIINCSQTSIFNFHYQVIIALTTKHLDYWQYIKFGITYTFTISVVCFSVTNFLTWKRALTLLFSLQQKFSISLIKLTFLSNVTPRYLVAQLCLKILLFSWQKKHYPFNILISCKKHKLKLFGVCNC